MARLLPPESAALEEVAREVGVGVGTLERWRSDALSRPARERAWTAAARLDAVMTTAAMDEAGKSAWCRGNGVYPPELAAWRQSATQAWPSPRRPGQPAADPAGPAAHQGTRARAAAQGQGAGRNGRLAGAVKKSRGDLHRTGRGRMTRLEDRQTLGPGHPHRARGRRAAAPGLRDGRHRRAHPAALEGRRRPRSGRWPALRGPPAPGHALSAAERAEMLRGGQRAALRRDAAGAHRPDAGRRRRLHRQRIQLPPRAARARADATAAGPRRPGPRRPADHAHRHRAPAKSGAGT